MEFSGIDNDISTLIVARSDLKSALNFMVTDKQRYKLLHDNYVWKILHERDYAYFDCMMEKMNFDRYTFCYAITRLKINLELRESVKEICQSDKLILSYRKIYV